MEKENKRQLEKAICNKRIDCQNLWLNWKEKKKVEGLSIQYDTSKIVLKLRIFHVHIYMYAIRRKRSEGKPKSDNNSHFQGLGKGMVKGCL